MASSFNTQPPEGGWTSCSIVLVDASVSTHSRPKAAAINHEGTLTNTGFNTQPPEGGCCNLFDRQQLLLVSTHSRPKAADEELTIIGANAMFQHTAARRRLA